MDMAARSTRRRVWQRGPMLTLTLAGCLVLAACGPLGDDDADPTSTSESLAQPTEAVTEAAGGESTEPAASDEPAVGTSTPVQSAIDSTPDLEPIPGTTDSESPSTPVFNDVSSVASPIAESSASPVAQPVSTETTDGPAPDGDGTSGPIPATDDEPVETPTDVADTPDDTSGTPEASPVAGAGSLGDIEVVAVTSCEPEVIPDIALESTSYRTVSDVNVRIGPGADCDLLAISPIGGFMPVTILAGPVQREGDDFVWVQVEVAGEIGWVVTEALEPAES